MSELDAGVTARATPLDRAWRLGLRAAYRALRVYWRLREPRTRGAVVAVWHRGRVLLVRNSYRPGLCFPAGGIKPGESPIDAAVRELREETGIETTAGDLRATGEIPSRWESKRDLCIFFELQLEVAPPLRPDGREVTWAGFASPEQALAGPLVPPIRAYLERHPTPPAASASS